MTVARYVGRVITKQALKLDCTTRFDATSMSKTIARKTRLIPSPIGCGQTGKVCVFVKNAI